MGIAGMLLLPWEKPLKLIADAEARLASCPTMLNRRTAPTPLGAAFAIRRSRAGVFAGTVDATTVIGRWSRPRCAHTVRTLAANAAEVAGGAAETGSRAAFTGRAGAKARSTDWLRRTGAKGSLTASSTILAGLSAEAMLRAAEASGARPDPYATGARRRGRARSESRLAAYSAELVS